MSARCLQLEYMRACLGLVFMNESEPVVWDETRDLGLSKKTLRVYWV